MLKDGMGGFPIATEGSEDGNFLRFATWNVRGVNDLDKLSRFMSTGKDNTLDIIGLTETKLPERAAKKVMAAQRHYKGYWTFDPASPRGSGVGLLLRQDLAKYVRVYRWKGRFIQADFSFANYFRLRVLSVYYPCNSGAEQRALTKIVTDSLMEARTNGWTMVVMGDFNGVMDRESDRSMAPQRKLGGGPETPLLRAIQQEELVDCYRHLYPGTPGLTWHQGNRASRIDYIFASPVLASRLTAGALAGVHGSDHDLVAAEFNTASLMNKVTRAEIRRHRVQRIRFKFNEATEEVWEKYAALVRAQLTSLIPQSGMPTPETSVAGTQWLDKAWHTLRTAILRAAKEAIPFSQTNKSQAKSKKHCDLTKKIKRTGKFLRLVRSLRQDAAVVSVGEVGQAFRKAEVDWDGLSLVMLTEEDIRQNTAWEGPVRTLWDKWQKERAALKREQRDEQIATCIERRCDMFGSNMKRMLDNILDRQRERIDLTHVQSSENGRTRCIDKPAEVNERVKQHFYQWT
jgi:exonuclease III